MANVSDLIGSLYPILNLHTSTLTRHASQLRVAGFLPAEDENLAALEAATFLAAVTGSRAPAKSSRWLARALSPSARSLESPRVASRRAEAPRSSSCHPLRRNPALQGLR